MDAVFKGKYPDDMVDLYSKWTRFDFILPKDLEVISEPIDFLGVNYYSRSIVKDDPNDAFLRVRHIPPTEPVTDMGWEITPDGLTDLLVRIRDDYGETPVYVTENGAAFADELDASGQVNDEMRVDFLKGHLEAAAKSIDYGVPLKGFYVWTLLDNFEWSFGYSKRFGIVYVDFATQRRIPKRSALWYKYVIAANGW